VDNIKIGLMGAYVFVLNMFGLDRLGTNSCRDILGAFAKHLLIFFFHVRPIRPHASGPIPLTDFREISCLGV
jgi:hypothetical protein